MNKNIQNMKLKVRAAILSCGILSFCAIFIAINELPTLHDKKITLLSQYKAGRNFEDLEDQPHIFTFRKRLNKSNYSSDNISPELGKRSVDFNTVTNETVEDDVKQKEDSVQEEEINGDKVLPSNDKIVDDRKSDEFNVSDPYVDKLIYLLQTADGVKFGFEKAREIPYYRILRQIGKRTRKKGIGLPIYRNYYGGFVFSYSPSFN